MAAGSKDLASSVMEWGTTPTTLRRIGLGTFGDGFDCRRPPCGAAAGAWPRIGARHRAQDDRHAPRIEPLPASPAPDARHRQPGPGRASVAGPEDLAVLRRAAAAGRAAGLARPAAHAAPRQPDDAVGQPDRQLPRHGRQAGRRSGAPAGQGPQPGLGRLGGQPAAADRGQAVLRRAVRAGAGRHRLPGRSPGSNCWAGCRSPNR